MLSSKDYSSFLCPKVPNPGQLAAEGEGGGKGPSEVGHLSVCEAHACHVEIKCAANLCESPENPQFVSLCRAQNSLYVLLSPWCAWRFPNEIPPGKAFPVRGGELLFSGKCGRGLIKSIVL